MTFYRNFKEKDDLFIYVCREKLSEFKNTLNGYEKLNNYIIAYEFFDFLKTEKFYKILNMEQYSNSNRSSRIIYYEDC